jgi:hypothetical protein
MMHITVSLLALSVVGVAALHICKGLGRPIKHGYLLARGFFVTFGLAIFLLGMCFHLWSWPYSAFFSALFCVLGAQISLWSIGIDKEILGNRPYTDESSELGRGPNTISQSKFALYFVLVIASVFILVAVIGSVPVPGTQPLVGSGWRIGLAASGFALLVIGLIYKWLELRIKGIGIGTVDQVEFAKRVADEIVSRVGLITPVKAKNESFRQLLFAERMSHFYEEKQYIADQFASLLLDRCRFFAETGKQVYLLIDSGTTLYPFFEKLGRAAVYAKANKENWVNNLWIETNNLPGVEILMQEGRANPSDPLSPLAVKCELFPGTPLPFYLALTGKKTNKALEILRKEAVDNSVFITLTTGDWIRLRRSPPTCPVVLARGEGHLEFKQALIKNSDEIYVIAPLGKIFTQSTLSEVNCALGIGTVQPGSEMENDLEKQPYREVEVDNEKAKQVKLVSTSRLKRRNILETYSANVLGFLGVEPHEYESIKEKMHKADIADLQHFVVPFDELPNDWAAQFEKEFPHEYTRNREFVKRFRVSDGAYEYWETASKLKRQI